MACEAPVSADGETYNLYDGLEEVEGTPTVTIHQGEAVGRDAWFEFTIDNIEPTVLAPGVYDGWCMEWNKPIAQQGDVHENLRMYSTHGQERWKPLNYFLNIKDELKADDSTLSFLEFQAVIWVISEGPEFNLNTLSNDEIPSRLMKDGEPRFDKQKVLEIATDIKTNASSFEYGLNTTYAMFMQTGEDEQDVMVPMDPKDTVSHGYVEGVTPSDDPYYAERTYPVIQADWEGPGGDSRWLGWNLGATDAPESFDDGNLDRAGWFFTFNRSQGYYFDTTDPVPDNFRRSLPTLEDWNIDNDPCREALEGNWRIPTEEEWQAVSDNAGAALNVHLAGFISNQQGVLTPPSRLAGTSGAYWSSTAVDNTVRPVSGFAAFPTSQVSGSIGSVDFTFQRYGHTIRCIEG